MTEIDIVKAQCKRILELLEIEDIEKSNIRKEASYGSWNATNKDNVELRQRLKMLRKDTLLLEKKIG